MYMSLVVITTDLHELKDVTVHLLRDVSQRLTRATVTRQSMLFISLIGVAHVTEWRCVLVRFAGVVLIAGT